MSRIGKQPIKIPNGVEVTVNGVQISVKGPKGTLSRVLHARVIIKIADGEVRIERASDEPKDRALHGLTRSLVNNMIIGVTAGFEKKLELQGVGFRAQAQGKKLTLSIGFSHPVIMQAPEGISFEVQDSVIVVKGNDCQMVGEMAARVRQQYVPEPYKGKGIRYIGEHVHRKEGKRVVASGS